MDKQKLCMHKISTIVLISHCCLFAFVFLLSGVINSKMVQIIFTLVIDIKCTICDQILGNGSKSHMKYSIFLHVFNDISSYANMMASIYNIISVIKYWTQLIVLKYYRKPNAIVNEVINILKIKCVIWIDFPKLGHIFW